MSEPLSQQTATTESVRVVPPPLADLLFPVAPAASGAGDSGRVGLTVEIQAIQAPLFTPEEADRLTRVGTEMPTLVDRQGGRWRPLAGWLGDPASAAVVCRKSRLSVRLAAADPAVSLLAFATAADGQSSLEARLELGGGRGDVPIPLVQLDRQAGYLQLMLPFDGAAGQALYERVVAAMRAPASEAQVALRYTHTLAVGGEGADGAGAGWILGQPVLVFSGTLKANVQADLLRADLVVATPNPQAGSDRWESLGGVITSGPDVCSWGEGRLDVFARGTDNALWHKWYDGGWSDWESLGGQITSDPSAVCWGPGRIDVFARGMDNALWHLWYEGGWSGWESLGGGLGSGPDACSWAPGRLDVFVLGTDTALWHKWYEGGWSDWEGLGGALTSDPGAVSWGPGRIDVFARGTDNALWHKAYEGGWNDWEPLGGFLGSGPDAASWRPGRLDIFVLGGDRALWQKSWDDSVGWSEWQSIGGVLTSDPGAVSWSKNRIDVFARGTDDALWHTWYDGSWGSGAAALFVPMAVAPVDFAVAAPVAVAEPNLRFGVVQPVVAVDPNIRFAGGRPIEDDPRPRDTEESEGREVRQMPVAQTHAIPVGRSGDRQADAYPDQPPPGRSEWTELPADDARSSRLFFKRSDRADVFFYLPACYRLAFYLDGDGRAVHPPLRPVHYRPPVAPGAPVEDRIKVTLTAIPYVDAADRERLRRHIQQVVLRDTLPFVRLAPAALRAEFQPQFSSGGGVLPEGIQFRGVAIAADRELSFEFDMGAREYPLFCELLRHGLRGRVLLTADGFELAVDALLELDRMVANGLAVRPLPARGDGALPFTLENLLDHPVAVASAHAFLVDRGSDVVPEMVFHAEAHDLLPGAARLARRGAPGASLELAVPAGDPRVAWDQMAVALGAVAVEGGTPEEWLDRVHRDPTLQPLDFSLQVSASFPDSARQRIEGVQVRLTKEGETAVRAERLLRPADPPWNVTLSLPLGELARATGGLPSFALEHYTVYQDLGPGQPQRALVSLNDRDARVRALAETADSRYTVVHGEAREAGRTRAQVEEILGRLRAAGGGWQLYVDPPVDPAPAPPG